MKVIFDWINDNGEMWEKVCRIKKKEFDSTELMEILVELLEMMSKSEEFKILLMIFLAEYHSELTSLEEEFVVDDKLFDGVKTDNRYIKKVCEGFVDSEEYDNGIKAKELHLDLSWIKDKIDVMDLIKLEEVITSYSSLNEEFMFESGFIYAWNIFNQCADKDKK